MRDGAHIKRRQAARAVLFEVKDLSTNFVRFAMALFNSSDLSVVCSQTTDGPLGGRIKRLFDFSAALLAIIVIAPLLLLLIVLSALLQGGPVFIKHKRVGLGGSKFSCLKFRTMVVDANDVLCRHLKENPAALEEWERSRKLTVDPRITPLGRILRKTSLDELPQLFNIIFGEMSFVGPRPIVDEEVYRYGPAFGDYCRARPGLTGRWQVSGRNDTGYDTRVALDQHYVNNWSFFLDLKIIVLTVPAVIMARGVY